VGDVLLASGPCASQPGRDPALLAPDVRAVLAECDLVIGNLEFTLPGDGRHVPSEPRVVAEPECVAAVAAAGLHAVSLANNHVFDCLEAGFLRLRGRLQQDGLRHFGAGMDLAEASAAAVVEVNGARLALLGAADLQSGPYQFAETDRFGVAPLDVPRLVDQIGRLHSEVDHVIVSLHWGQERFLIPSPAQIEQARALVDAGASMVLGHHPHVLQGVESWRDRPIVYSLGNFVADDVRFDDGDVMRWNRTERTGCILLAELRPEGVRGLRQVPTYDDGRLVHIDRGSFGRQRIERVNAVLARGVSPGRYRREHLWVKTIRPVLRHLRWSQLGKLRLRHVRNGLGQLWRSLRAR